MGGVAVKQESHAGHRSWNRPLNYRQAAARPVAMAQALKAIGGRTEEELSGSSRHSAVVFRSGPRRPVKRLRRELRHA